MAVYKKDKYTGHTVMVVGRVSTTLRKMYGNAKTEEEKNDILRLAKDVTELVDFGLGVDATQSVAMDKRILAFK